MKTLKGRSVCGCTLLLLLLGILFVAFKRRAEVEPTGHGFVMTLEYTGQQVAGLRALLSQQCWISSFNLPLVIVEPFSSNSLLRHSHQLWDVHLQDKPTVLFRDLFDMYHYNEQSYVTGNPVLVSLKNFLRDAPRKVILVTIEDIHHPGCLVFQEDMCTAGKESLSSKTLSGCSITGSDLQVFSFLRRHNFYIVRHVCINCAEAMTSLTPDAVTRHIFHHNPRDVTVLFNKWRFSMKVTKGCREMETCSNEKAVLPQRIVESKRLEVDANWYLESYFHSQMVISIMIRVEWHFITNRKDQHGRNNATYCLGEVLKAVTEIQREFGDSTIPTFLSMDVGTYGSGTFEHTIRRTNTSTSMYTAVLNHTRHFVKQLYRGAWSFSDWEESFLTIPGVLPDRGYIATLQRTIASKGDCLILMGGGHFQHMALQTYLNQHPKKEERCVKYVCVAPPFQRLFDMDQN